MSKIQVLYSISQSVSKLDSQPVLDTHTGPQAIITVATVIISQQTSQAASTRHSQCTHFLHRDDINNFVRQIRQNGEPIVILSSVVTAR